MPKTESDVIDGLEADAYGMGRDGRASAHPTRWGAGVWEWDTVAWLLWDSAPATYPSREAAMKAARAKRKDLLAAARTELAQAA